MSTITTPRPPAPPAVPPLQPGDRMGRVEFERRFDATPGLKKAELIEGVVYMPPPPVSFDFHSAPHADVLGWMSVYRAATPGVRVGDNGSIRLDLNNMPQPDALMIVDPARGGQARIGSDNYIEGAPELVFEVAASSVSYDLHPKLALYRRHGAKEYVVWRTYDVDLDYFVLKRNRYVPLPADADGVYRSGAFPGLWLDGPRLLAGDLAGVLGTLNVGLATPEHAAFAAKLAGAVG